MPDLLKSISVATVIGPILLAVLAIILAAFLPGETIDNHDINNWLSFVYLSSFGAILHFARGKTHGRKVHSKRLVKNTAVAEKLAGFLSNPDFRSTLRAILFAESRSKVWRWLVATPPRSSLAIVLGEFKSKTPISLELVFMGWICLLSQYLAEKGATIRWQNQIIRLDLYTVILAGSGGLKSWSFSRMLAALLPYWTPKTILDAGSTAGLMQQLKESDGQACFWRIEEFGPLFVEFDKEAHAGTKRLILMNYDGESIGRGLKDEKIIVEKPYLSFFGTTVLTNLSKQIKAEDWRSGLCQRIAFVRAATDPDPARDWRNEKFALLAVDESKIGRAFKRLTRTPIHQEYIFSSEAIRQIKKCWKMVGQHGEHEFVRRLEFRAFKYAVVYHVMLGKASNELDAEDIVWAFRVAMLHLADLKCILDETEYADFEELLQRGETFRQRCLEKGKPFRPAELQMRMSRHLRSIAEAKSLFLLICENAHRRGAKGLPPAHEIEALTGHWPDYAPRPRVPDEFIDLDEKGGV